MSKLTVFFAVIEGDRLQIASLVRDKLAELAIEYTPVFACWQDAREIFASECEGSCLLICDGPIAKGVEGMEDHDLDGFHTIIIGQPLRPSLVSVRRAYASIEALGTQLELAVAMMSEPDSRA